MDHQNIAELQELLGYQFNNPGLLIEAFTHASVADSRIASNERLEFFGDSILAFVVCKKLFEKFPNYLEGDLTKIKSMLVSRKTCAAIANALQVPEYAKVGKGMSGTKAISGSISAGILEAIIAAIFIDGGMESAEEFILRIFEPLIEKTNAEQHHENYKSLLQQYSQRKFQATPVYELLDEKGPDHNKCFEMCAVIDLNHFPGAWGSTKKEAEQKAAQRALIELKVIKQQVKSE
jgi:ribonuclease III